MKQKLLNELKKNGNKEFAAHHAKFFQTHKGGYGQGDKFWGLKVPKQREMAKKYYKNITLKEAEELLKNKVHEVRLTGLMILIEKYQKSDKKDKKNIVKIYLRNTKHINNWDLVDLSAPQILGNYWFENKSTAEMYKLARSKNLWEERIAMISTFYFIKNGKFCETARLAKHFLKHKHDLMHKASGWMLREAGKRNIDVLYDFLNKHHKTMPRTMLRYAVEKLPENKRKYYMGK